MPKKERDYLPRALRPASQSAIASVCRNLEFGGVTPRSRWNYSHQEAHRTKLHNRGKILAPEQVVVSVSKLTGKKIVYAI